MIAANRYVTQINSNGRYRNIETKKENKAATKWCTLTEDETKGHSQYMIAVNEYAVQYIKEDNGINSTGIVVWSNCNNIMPMRRQDMATRATV